MHSGETCETLLPPHTKIPFRGIFFVWRRGILILTGSVQVVGTFFAHSKVPGNLFKSSRKVPRTLLPGQTKIPFRGIFFVWRRGILILTGSVQVVGTFFAHSKVPGNLFKSSRKVPRTLLPGQTKIPFRGIFFVRLYNQARTHFQSRS